MSPMRFITIQFVDGSKVKYSFSAGTASLEGIKLPPHTIRGATLLSQ